MFHALKDGGIACTQSECMWLHLDLIKNLVNLSQQIYQHAEYAYTTIPSYPCGQLGLLLCSKGESCKKPRRKLTAETKYYTPEIHEAAFVLPAFARDVLYPIDSQESAAKKQKR
jgi:spermidine synthase